MKNLLWIVIATTTIFAQSICIDAGHGGSDPGAVGWGLQEKTINLDVSQRLYNLMRQSGWKAYLVRSSDKTVSLSGRTSYANSLGVKRFVSIHCNAFNKSANGTETFAYTKGSSTSFSMRNSVHPRLVRAMRTKDRGTKTANFYVIKHTNMPAILCELAFIDEKSDSSKLGDSYYRQKAAEAIHAGIVSTLTALDEEIRTSDSYMAPKWSPDGTALLITHPGYNGVRVMKMDDYSIHNVSSANTYNAKWISSHEIVCGAKDETKLLDTVTGKTVSTFAGLDMPIAVVKDGTLTVAEHVISLENDVIFNAVASPDNKFVAYESLKNGIHVVNVESGKSVRIGQGNNPAWMPDSTGIVFDRALDNGHEITQSNIFLASVDGQNVVNLTQNLSLIAQRPSVSPDGQKIAFDAQGSIFIAAFAEQKIQQILQVTK
ncbi:N-acetylmuramoyl-L-alanine amidase family protein [Candidatus Uabimicrobium amorphum]|uniref:N-acetylmuramoyl-L-alanine amidase n=1 Tax=Uabimicrobium amorphum TaxID=2596890 RepID=A0A5S9F7F4_UABAM|nr:N-acetylmuramoyl-L-alanine amidase [Candidatus Uabimicrobium amorphum]BBM87669.1 hypothetical protein UABAM_06081 [Candidatus Uabimicrobium amorphum]